MLTADHPNALWLAGLYRSTEEIENNPHLDTEAREAKAAELLKAAAVKFSPNLVVHTGGIRLAATLRLAQVSKYGAKRKALTNGTFKVIKVDQILADDFFGVISCTVLGERNGHAHESRGMGAWFFDDGLAVEHWEIPHGAIWDQMFLDDDADPNGTAEDFWMRD